MAKIYNVDYFIRRTRKVKAGVYDVTLSQAELVLEFPQQPNSVEITDKHNYQVYYNVRGERIVRRPISTHKPRNIMLTFNVSPYDQVYPAAERPAYAPASQPRAVKEVLLSFTNLIQAMRSDIDRFDLIDLKAGVVYTDCELDNYTVAQNANSQRFGFMITLSLTAFSVAPYAGVINQPIAPPLTRVADPADTRSSFRKYIDAMNATSRKLRGVSDSIRYAGAFVQDTVQEGVAAPLGIANAALAVPLAAASAIDSIVASIDNVNNALVQTTALAGTAIHSLYQAYNNAKLFIESFNPDGDSIYTPYVDAYNTTLRQLELELPPVYQPSKDVVDATQTAVPEVGLATAEAALLIELAYGYARMRMPYEPRLATVGEFLSNPENIKKLAMFSGNTAFSANILDVETVPYTLRFGECLMDVADRLTGDASRWIEIAQVNNWSSPYTDAQDQVAAAGTPLQIPADMISGINITDNLNLLTNRGEPLLTDLRLTDGDLSLSSGAATVSGIDNFNQAIINRLSTKLGEQIGLPTYGLSDLSGAKQTDTTIAFITDRVITQLLSDPRVYSVRDVSVLLNGDKVDVKLTIFTVDKQATELTIPLN